MPETWPESLPQCFLLGSYVEAENDGNLIEGGKPVLKSRPRFTAFPRPADGTMRLRTQAQVDALRGFGRVTLIMWSLPFWFPAQSGESDADMPGYVLVKFRDDGIPRLSRIAGRVYDVPLGLHILP